MPKLSPPHEYLLRRITEARRALNFTQKDVASQWGVPQQRVSRIETGERRLDVVEFVTIALILEIDPHEVLDELQSALRAVRKTSKRTGNLR